MQCFCWIVSHNKLISSIPKVTPPTQSPAPQRGHEKHPRRGRLCSFSALHTMHRSWDSRALICAKSLQVFPPHPMRCDKPTGAQQMPLKKLHQLPCAFVCCVFVTRCDRRGKKKSWAWMQSWVKKQRKTVRKEETLLCLFSPVAASMFLHYLFAAKFPEHRFTLLLVVYPSAIFTEGKAFVNKHEDSNLLVRFVLLPPHCIMKSVFFSVLRGICECKVFHYAAECVFRE